MVCAETLLFTDRLQGIEELTFSDGTPFADQETKAWLKTIGIGQTGGAIAGGGDGAAAEVSKAFGAAQKLVQDNKALDGIQLIEDGLNHAGSGKERILWNIALCRIFLQLGKADLAVPVVERIIHTNDTFQLDKWDTELSIECFGIAYEILSVSTVENAQARALEILQRITQLSPTKALRIAGIK